MGARSRSRLRSHLRNARVDVLVSDDELAERRKAYEPPQLVNQTPWQELYRSTVGPLSTGACMEFAVAYQDVAHVHGPPRDSH